MNPTANEILFANWLTFASGAMDKTKNDSTVYHKEWIQQPMRFCLPTDLPLPLEQWTKQKMTLLSTIKNESNSQWDFVCQLTYLCLWSNGCKQWLRLTLFEKVANRHVGLLKINMAMLKNTSKSLHTLTETKKYKNQCKVSVVFLNCKSMQSFCGISSQQINGVD